MENLAPNGKKSNLTPEQYKLVRTPAFKKWFGDWENSPETASKVVDENREPLVVYHGVKSGEKFNVFSQTTDIGFHFAIDKNIAKGMSKNEKLQQRATEEGYWYEEVLYECFLNIRTVEFIADLELWKISDFEKHLNELAIDNNFNWGYNRKIGRIENTRNLYSKIEGAKSNFDGLWYINEYEGRFTKWKKKCYIVFDPTQIKLADGTNTTFDGNNPDIRYAKGGTINNSFEYTIGGL